MKEDSAFFKDLFSTVMMVAFDPSKQSVFLDDKDNNIANWPFGCEHKERGSFKKLHKHTEVEPVDERIKK